MHFKLLLNNEVGRSEQAKNPAGYHIAICETRVHDSDAAAKEATDELAATTTNGKRLA